MHEHDIRAVINCAPRVPNHFEGSNIVYLHLDIEESSEITSDVASTVRGFATHHAGHGNILVHCAGGNQRSPAIVMLLLAARGMSLLEAFKRATGCSVLVNTSFNVRDEPIVCTPDDAWRCFMGTEMDLLVMNNTNLWKDAQ